MSLPSQEQALGGEFFPALIFVGVAAEIDLARPADFLRRMSTSDPHRAFKLGLLLYGDATKPGFQHGVRLAAAALDRGFDTYLYCLDDAVAGVGNPNLQALRQRGLKLYACAYGAHQRGLPVDDQATYAGLTVVSDLFSSTDRLVSFN